MTSAIGFGRGIGPGFPSETNVNGEAASSTESSMSPAQFGAGPQTL
jgi:hypothetical protein